MKISEQLNFLPILFLITALAGCAQVAPWERGNLAKPHMALEPYPMQNSLRAHTYGSREASAGGGSSEGGGCGCY
jgi:hypothetical protein